jgi:surface polysaccharide O-acyltransferase-like enzyme
MSDMSPLQRLLLKAMRYASLGAAILLLGFLALAFWQKSGTEFTTQDYGFMGIVGVMLLGALWLFRAIGREMDNPGA